MIDLCISEELVQDVLVEFYAKCGASRLCDLERNSFNKVLGALSCDFDLLFHALHSRRMECLAGFVVCFFLVCLLGFVICLWLSVSSGLG